MNTFIHLRVGHISACRNENGQPILVAEPTTPESLRSNSTFGILGSATVMPSVLGPPLRTGAGAGGRPLLLLFDDALARVGGSGSGGGGGGDGDGGGPILRKVVEVAAGSRAGKSSLTLVPTLEEAGPGADNDEFLRLLQPCTATGVIVDDKDEEDGLFSDGARVAAAANAAGGDDDDPAADGFLLLEVGGIDEMGVAVFSGINISPSPVCIAPPVVSVADDCRRSVVAVVLKPPEALSFMLLPSPSPASREVVMAVLLSKSSWKVIKSFAELICCLRLSCRASFFSFRRSSSFCSFSIALASSVAATSKFSRALSSCEHQDVCVHVCVCVHTV